LKLCDVDLQNGVLKLEHAKHNKRRYVPLSPDITVRCRTLTEQIHQLSNSNDFFFPNARNNAHHPTAVYDEFREILRKAQISHGGKGKGPRLHDLRHTFSVHCLQKWERNGVDLNVALPYLCAYLGHKKLSGTQKYLHLTTEAHKDVTKKLEVYSQGIIPKLEGSII
jgi:integrase